jgi:hypothetical protein
MPSTPTVPTTNDAAFPQDVGDVGIVDDVGIFISGDVGIDGIDGIVLNDLRTPG